MFNCFLQLRELQLHTHTHKLILQNNWFRFSYSLYFFFFSFSFFPFCVRIFCVEFSENVLNEMTTAIRFTIKPSWTNFELDKNKNTMKNTFHGFLLFNSNSNSNTILLCRSNVISSIVPIPNIVQTVRIEIVSNIYISTLVAHKNKYSTAITMHTYFRILFASVSILNICKRLNVMTI